MQPPGWLWLEDYVLLGYWMARKNRLGFGERAPSPFEWVDALGDPAGGDAGGRFFGGW
jgi:hypothetical protein